VAAQVLKVMVKHLMGRAVGVQSLELTGGFPIILMAVNIRTDSGYEGKNLRPNPVY
jgi:hypothetical protein